MAVMHELTVQNIMDPLVRTAMRFIAEQTGLQKKSSAALKLDLVEKLVLRDVSSFIDLKGIINGKLVVSMDRRLIAEIVRNLCVEDLGEEEVEEYIEDTLAECSNIILGNSIKLIPYFEEYISVNAPMTLCSQYAAFRYSDTVIWTCVIDCRFGSASLSFISADLAA